MRNSIEAVLNQSPAYQGLKMIPGLSNLPRQLNERLVTETTSTAYSTLVAILDDPAVTELAAQLVKNFGKNLMDELKQQDSLQELQSLVNDLLEEVKVNYVQPTGVTGVEAYLKESHSVKKMAGGGDR